jgi:hypothetical protein
MIAAPALIPANPLGALADADHQHHRDERHDQERGKIGDDGEAEQVGRRGDCRGEILAGRVGRASRQRLGREMRRSVVGREPGRHRDAEVGQELAEIARPPDRHADVAHRVLDDQVPADDPRHQLAERGVRVGVRRARDRHHRGELGVTERGEPAGERGEQERDDDRGTGAGAERVADDRRARGGEDAGADRGPDAERRQVPLAEGALEAAALEDVVLAVLD